jgi:hypothetical protein
MRSGQARWLVGASIVVAIVPQIAHAEAAPSQAPPQQAPQPQAPPQQAPRPAPKAPTAKAPAKAAAQPKAQTATQPKAQAATQPKAQAATQPKAQAVTNKKAPPQPQAAANAASAADSGAQVLPAEQPSPATPTCTVMPVTGTPIFEARYVAGGKSVVTRLYATGTYTRAVLKSAPRSACIETARLDAIKSALGEARWQATKTPPSCKPTGQETTQIYASGALRFTSRQCSPLVLDAKSSHALDLIASYVGAFGLDMKDELTVDGN